MNALPHIVTDRSITVVCGSKSHIIPSSHPNFLSIREAIREDRWQDINNLIDIPKSVMHFSGGKVEIVNGVVCYEGEQVHNVIADRILRMMSERFNVQPLINFLANLMQNPSKQAVDELYLFLEAGNLPITEDGHFLAYKMVRQDYLSHHDGRTDNSIGNMVEMPRNKVDDRRDVTCSYGLHFCSEGYLGKYYGHGRTVILKINPADVVSIPKDYNNAKGRACRYQVIGEMEQDFTTETMNRAVWSENQEPVQDHDGDFDDGNRSVFRLKYVALTTDGDHATGTVVVTAESLGDAQMLVDDDYVAEDLAWVLTSTGEDLDADQVHEHTLQYVSGSHA